VAKSPLLLLGAMVGTDTITFDQAKQWVEFCDEADANHTAPATLEVAVDMALTYFRADPDTEAAKEAARVAAVQEITHDEDTCPDCGGPMCEEGPDEADFDQAMELWAAVRNIADKYAFDRRDFADGREEC